MTDSIAAVEAAWGKVAKDIGQDPAYVIAATHGKRAIDNLSQFKPSILPHQMESEVQNFEESILFFADAYSTHGPESALDSESCTPALTPGSSAPSSRASSFASLSSASSRRPSFASRLSSALMMSTVPEADVMDQYHAEFENPYMEETHVDMIDDQPSDKSKIHQLEAWQLEASAVDRSVQILPGVKRMIDSIPAGLLIHFSNQVSH